MDEATYIGFNLPNLSPINPETKIPKKTDKYKHVPNMLDS